MKRSRRLHEAPQKPGAPTIRIFIHPCAQIMINLLIPAARSRSLAELFGEPESTVCVMAFGCLVLAAVSALALMAGAGGPLLGPASHAGSAEVLSGLIGLVLWVSLMAVFGAAWCTGAFDPLLRHRVVQAVLLTVAVTAVAYLSCRSVGQQAEAAAPAFVLPVLAWMAAALALSRGT